MSVPRGGRPAAAPCARHLRAGARLDGLQARALLLAADPSVAVAVGAEGSVLLNAETLEQGQDEIVTAAIANLVASRS